MGLFLFAMSLIILEIFCGIKPEQVFQIRVCTAVSGLSGFPLSLHTPLSKSTVPSGHDSKCPQF